MKIVVLMRPGRINIAQLAARHPRQSFVPVEDAAGLARELPVAEVLVTANTHYDAPVAAIVKHATRLKWIQFTTSGIDAALRAGGFPDGAIVTNGAGMAAPMVAEHAFALALMVGHRLRDMEQAAARGEWRRDIRDSMIALYGRTICIIGLGAVGREAARRARAFGMTVIGVSRAAVADELVEHVYARERLLEALARADVVMVTTVATAETVDLIDSEAFAAMKPSAILVNVARGELIDEDALAAACRTGRIAGAGLDVVKTEPLPADSPLWRLSNVVVTPHLAGGGADNSSLIVDLIDQNLSRYLRGERLTHIVDWKNIRLA